MNQIYLQYFSLKKSFVRFNTTQFVIYSKLLRAVLNHILWNRIKWKSSQAVHENIKKSLIYLQTKDKIPEIVRNWRFQSPTQNMADPLIKLCLEAFCCRFLPFLRKMWGIKCRSHMTQHIYDTLPRWVLSRNGKHSITQHFVLFTKIINIYKNERNKYFLMKKFQEVAYALKYFWWKFH